MKQMFVFKFRLHIYSCFMSVVFLFFAYTLCSTNNSLMRCACVYMCACVFSVITLCIAFYIGISLFHPCTDEHISKRQAGRYQLLALL